MARAVGIDLGTTNSCVAVVEDGTPRILTWPNGAKTIPSVFAIDKSGQRLVGEEARAQQIANPENTVSASKRLIGRAFDSKVVEQMSQVFTYELLEGESSEVLVKVANQVLTLEQVSAAILLRLKEHAERTLGEEVTSAVITVPAYFNDRQRQAVRGAGRLAGLDVLRVLNEPTAAALAYGLGRRLDQRVAIYDLGGGTFDISIIDIKDKLFEVVATGGDTFLGGVDFDDRVMQFVLKSFYHEHAIDLSYDRVAVTRIREACESAKIQLSDVLETEILLEDIATNDDGQPIDVLMSLSRDRLEDLTGDLVQRSIQACERNFKIANTTPSDIDELLLVGGQSRMPLVRRSVEEYLGRPPSDKVNPDEAVAIGAAIMAHSLAGRRTTSSLPEEQRDVTLHDVLPVPIGLAKPDGKLLPLFPRNQPLPARKVRTLTTSKDDQRSIVLKMYQGDAANTADNESLGTFVFHGLRKGPKGLVRLDVTFHIDSEGILNLSATDKDTGEVVGSRIRLDGKEDEDDRPPAPELAAVSPSIAPDVPELGAESLDLIEDDLMPMPAPSVATASGALKAIAPEPKVPRTPATIVPASEPVLSAASAYAPPDPPAAPPEPAPPPSIENLRAQARRVEAPEVEARTTGGFFGWLKRLFGRG
jgi:molecular chaperone DnaK